MEEKALSQPLGIDEFRLIARFNKADPNVVEHPEKEESILHRLLSRKPTSKKTWKTTGERLGEGDYGKVYLQKDQDTAELRAVKEIKLEHRRSIKSKGLSKDNERELSAMLALRDNPLFVKLLGWYTDKPKNFKFIYTAMEYVEEGDLSQNLLKHRFGGITEGIAGEIISQVLEGLDVLHQRKIRHGDLKPKNILIAGLDPIRIKLADFGLSRMDIREASAEATMGPLGAAGYLAPELFNLAHFGPGSPSDTRAVDMWALGCLFFEILTHHISFVSIFKNTRVHSGVGILQYDQQLFESYCQGSAEFPKENMTRCIHISERGLDFARKCLTPDPQRRITASDAMSHRWITKRNDQDTLLLRYEKKMISPEETLIFAAECGYTDIISRLLQLHSFDLNSEEARVNGRTVLQVAAGGGHIGLVSFLLDNGADINLEASEFEGRTALQAAAGGGYNNVVILLLNEGADINAKPGEIKGRTALQAAAGAGHIGTVKLLIERGALVDARAGYDGGLTALQAAAGGGHIDIVKLLLKEGADIDCRAGDEGGRTAIQAAAGGGHVEVIKILLWGKHHPPGAQRWRLGRLWIAGSRLVTRHTKVILNVRYTKAILNAAPRNGGGLTALQAAAGGGHRNAVEFLLEKGTDINARAGESGGRTALQAAAGSGHIEIVKLLFRKGARVDAKATNSKGRTALQAAADGGHIETISWLLGAGADINERAVDYHGRTALQAAAENGHIKIVKYLLERGADINAMPCHYGGRTALQAASGNGHIEIVKLLLNEDSEGGNKEGKAMGDGIKTGDIKCANINAEAGDIEGRTALQAAICGGHVEVVKLLIENGAKVDDSAGWCNGLRSIDAAIEKGNEELLKLISMKL